MAEGSGLERIAVAFDAARDQGRAALMPYMMGGYPSVDRSAAIAEAYIDSGADLIELGVPYSDPLADGPVIHAAATATLQAGVTLDDVLEICAGIGERVPVILMIYANMVLAQGEELFALRAAEAGASGVIVPDLPIEEAAGLAGHLADRGLALIPLVAPTTPADRRASICRDATGFVYVVSLAGVTGERAELAPELGDLVQAVRAESPVPAAVGFGIASAEHAAAVGSVADGVIIGSKLVGMSGGDSDDPVASVQAFLAAAFEALQKPTP